MENVKITLEKDSNGKPTGFAIVAVTVDMAPVKKKTIGEYPGLDMVTSWRRQFMQEAVEMLLAGLQTVHMTSTEIDALAQRQKNAKPVADPEVDALCPESQLGKPGK